MEKSNVSQNEVLTSLAKTFQRLVSLFLSTLILAAGCQAGPWRSVKSFSPCTPEGPAMELAAGLYQRGASLNTLAARGGVNFITAGRRNFFHFEALALKPGRLMFTALNPTGNPTFRLASDGTKLTGIIYGTRQYVTGPATTENFGRFIPLGLSPDQLIAIMSGSQVRPAAASYQPLGKNTELTIVPAETLDNDKNIWRLRLTGGLTQNPLKAVIVTAIHGEPLNPDISIRYLSIRELPREDEGGRLEPFPQAVEIDWNLNQQKRNLRINYDDVRLGLTLEPATFTLDKPAGFKIIQLP